MANSETAIIIGAVIEKDGKYLLVQEAQEKCHGKWNLPAGHLDPNETLIEGTIRETKEETGCDIKPTSICQIGNRVSKNDIFVSVIFTAKLLHEEIAFDKSEILDAKWFTYEEILALGDQIRSQTLMLGAINNTRNGLTVPISIVNQY